MANLNEISQWEAGIYQLETADPVLGGPDGVDNLQAKQLGNRTRYLKDKLDKLESGEVVPPGIATQSYVQAELNKRDAKQSVRVATTANIALNGVQAVDGIAIQVGDRVLVKNQNDPTQNGIYLAAAGAWARTLDADENADVTAGMVVVVEQGAAQADTIWKLTTDNPINLGVSTLSFADITAGYAPLNSPSFSGNPTAPTPPQFDNDQSVPTTAFVQRALGNLAGHVSYNAATVLSAAHAGKLVSAYGAGGFALTLPPVGDLGVAGQGAAIHFMNNSAGNVTLGCAGANKIQTGSTAQTPTLTLGPGEVLTLVAGNDASNWMLAGGSAALAYAQGFKSSLAANGWQKLPSGLIIQWATVSTPTGPGSTTPFLWPIAFPTALLAAAMAANYAASANSYGLALTLIGQTVTGATLDCIGNGGNVSSVAATTVIAIGY